MFGMNNLFSFFSGFTFRSLSRFSFHSTDTKPASTETPTTLSGSQVDTQPAAKPDATAAPEVVEPPKDTIELSQPQPDAPVDQPPATYSPDTIAQKTPADETPAPAEQPDQPEVVEEPSNDPVLVASRTRAKFNLNMIFNLSQFEQTVSAFAEDAQDGQVNIADYTDLNIGLHTKLKMKVSQKEYYQLAEGTEGTPAELKYRERGRLFGLSSALLKSRGFEAAAFYRESMRASYKMNQEFEDGFLRVSRKLAMRYTQDFHLNLRSMNLYNTQAQAMDQTGDLNNYLNSTEALVDSQQASGDLLNQFFDTVQGYLDGAEEQLIDKVNNFFDAMAGEMGLDSSMFDIARDTMISSIEGFFGRIDSAVSNVTAKYMPQPEAPVEIPPPPDTPAPELEQATEAAAVA